MCLRAKLPEFDPKILPEWAEELAEFFADWPIPCGCGDQMLTAEMLMQKEIFAKSGEKDCENLFHLGRGTHEVGESVPSL